MSLATVGILLVALLQTPVLPSKDYWGIFDVHNNQANSDRIYADGYCTVTLLIDEYTYIGGKIETSNSK